MYYRLTYKHAGVVDEIGLQTNQDQAEIEAWDLLDNHGQIGSVVIERRYSEYYGDYKHVLTISQGLEEENRPTDTKKSLGPTPSTRYGRRPMKELCIFKQLKLDDEPKALRKLMWICECKSLTLKGSDTRKMLIDSQNKQIEFIKSVGLTYEDIEEFAEYYEFIDALVLN